MSNSLIIYPNIWHTVITVQSKILNVKFETVTDTLSIFNKYVTYRLIIFYVAMRKKPHRLAGNTTFIYILTEEPNCGKTSLRFVFTIVQ